MTTASRTRWPKITIVTPSFNQAPYIERTITSVLDQGYPNLEYIVIDGRSTDGSVDVIRKYSDHLAYWASEKDSGQTDAINKGMRRATGQLRAYLNSDDFYLPGALDRVARAAIEDPAADLIHGGCRIVDSHGDTIGTRRADIRSFLEIVDIWGVWWKERNFVQPEVFWTERMHRRIGDFREDLHMAMDFDFWARAFRAGARVHALDVELAAFRMTPTQKSNQRERAAGEILDVVRGHLWDRSAPLAGRTRLRLQAQWIYQTRFLAQVRESSEARQPRWRRLLGGAGIALRHPKVILCEEYRRRLVGAITPGEPHR